MLLKFKAVEGAQHEEEDAVDEICTFEGIRYDNDSNFAILSTEHMRHDYLIPMSREDYDSFVKDLYSYAAMCLMKPGTMVSIEGDPLIRVKHGSLTRWERNAKLGFKLSCEQFGDIGRQEAVYGKDTYNG